jgi:hypothetical protein
MCLGDMDCGWLVSQSSFAGETHQPEVGIEVFFQPRANGWNSAPSAALPLPTPVQKGPQIAPNGVHAHTSAIRPTQREPSPFHFRNGMVVHCHNQMAESEPRYAHFPRFRAAGVERTMPFSFIGSSLFVTAYRSESGPPPPGRCLLYPPFSTTDGPPRQGMSPGGLWETQGHGQQYTMRHTFRVCILATGIGIGAGKE